MCALNLQLVDTQAIYTDKGSGADMDVAIYQPILPDDGGTWYFVGHLAVTMPSSWSYNSSSVAERAPQAYVVQPTCDDPTAVAIVLPNTEYGAFQPLWTDQHSGGDQSIELYTFSAQKDGAKYVSLGLFASVVSEYGEDPMTTDPMGANSSPAWNSLVAIRSDLVSAGTVGEQIWNDQHSGADGNGIWQSISLWAISGSGGMGTFIGAEGYPSDPSSTMPSPQLLVTPPST